MRAPSHGSRHSRLAIVAGRLRECIGSVGARKEVTEADRSEADRSEAADVDEEQVTGMVTGADVAMLLAEEQVKGMVTGADVAMLAAEKQVTVAALVAAVVSLLSMPRMVVSWEAVPAKNVVLEQAMMRTRRLA